jgi:hypothetical protein
MRLARACLGEAAEFPRIGNLFTLAISLGLLCRRKANLFRWRA